jgi:hypothetical protein
MKLLVFAATLSTAFFAHADPIIDCPPDYQGGKMKPAMSVVRASSEEALVEVVTNEGPMQIELPSQSELLQKMLDEANKRCGFSD